MAWRQRSKSEALVDDYLDTDIPLMPGATLRQDPLQRVLENDDLKRFMRVLDHILTETQYRVAMMAWELGLPDAEIAQVLDCTVSTVHSHKSRARKKIEAMMNRTEAKIAFDSAEDLVEVIAEHRQTAGEATGTRAEGVRPA
ncbi:hypothetical protein O3I_024650 [Nocardia brasiliensis ATCC 700358]|uniref:HTH luxR-type domain-containing protein n=2 Tax=Nocardia brasiliensis TaxID=37326 RepID=K0ESW8_NOCB7|nr:hypothetical protein O3I_024650 [Nocardia brasiliensis ATCC 700358]